MKRYGFAILLLAIAGCDDDGALDGRSEILLPVGGGGSATISGTVRFPESTDESHVVTLTLATPGGTTSVATRVEPTERIRYRVTSITPGSITVGATVDRDDDGRLGVGDWAGFIGGSATTPALELGAAGQVTIVDTLEADIFIGPVQQCLAHQGESCVTADQCRTVRCVCGDGLATRIDLAPACNASVCEPAQVDVCDSRCAGEDDVAPTDGPCLRDLIVLGE